MGPRSHDIEYLQVRLTRVKQVFASVFRHDYEGAEELLISSSVSKDVVTELEVLRHELETAQLAKDLVPCADFLADSIFLFEKAINESESVTREDPQQSSESDELGRMPDFINQYYKKREEGETEYLKLDAEGYQNSLDYFTKALELIKGPVHKAGMSDLLFLD